MAKTVEERIKLQTAIGKSFKHVRIIETRCDNNEISESLLFEGQLNEIPENLKNRDSFEASYQESDTIIIKCLHVK